MTIEEQIQTTELPIRRSHLSFLLPLGFNNKKRLAFTRSLEKNEYTFFKLNEWTEQENIFGEDISVKSKELEQYFLPHTEHILFPISLKENGFHRFTKAIKKTFYLHIHKVKIPFHIQSLDITLGSFGIAFLTIRVTLDSSDNDLADVLDFVHHFRTVQPKLHEEQGAVIFDPDNNQPFSVHDLLFTKLCPFLKEFMLHDENLDRYFGSLPYYEDERMFVSAFLFSEDNATITDDQLYRMGAVNGRTSTGEIFISANNPSYICRFLNQCLHDRWAPHTYTIVTSHAFMTITNKRPESMVRKLSQFMGTHYYNLLLHYFYKIMLLRVAYEYSKINWEKDDEYVKSLIKFITLFSSLYYKKEVSTRSEGKEFTSLFQNAFHTNSLFKEVHHTLQALYKSQENHTADRMNMLLFVLTVFTVISGIYGMNLVIKDWELPSGWKNLTTYTWFEWIAFVTAITGIGLSVYLVITTFSKMLKSKWRKKNSKNQME
ncbi:hypothetical protein [Sporosarcina sp. HYO08]|uniref:hypothetical protein n=1 Tax=Sporosarcina sp. HYO08 TaxID=1759557 RepID=UPI0007954B6D|nr:hypothetical protein [Sporosarcina sp. HYO08]KXH87153.1 hypothetical protein AU377_00845 [Sporosarcina sp. HYO08]